MVNNTASIYEGDSKSKILTMQSGWTGGISDDLRAARFYRGLFFVSGFTITKHFDIFSQPDRIIPYRSLKSDDTSTTVHDMKQWAVKDFVYAANSPKLYGLGQNGSSYTKIVYKGLAIQGNWTVPASSDGNALVQPGCFFEYKNYLWGFQGTNQIWKWGALDGSPSITNSVTTVASTITSVANGLIAADGCAYMAYNNVIVRIATDGTTITDSAKTVPTTYKITSLANYGSYMAIGCSPTSPYNGKSKVFIWDLSSDLFADTIDWGEGDLRILENLNGTLTGITDRYLNNSAGAGIGSLVIQQATSGNAAASPVKEIFTKALTGKTIPLSKCVKNNRLFFAAKIMTNSAGTEYNEGIWSWGSKNAGYPNALTLDIIDENINTSGIQGFGNAANYFFIAHSNDGSIDKTDDSANYNFTSIFETNIYNWASTIEDKRLCAVKISYSPITSGQSVTLKVKVDGATSWTTIGTDSTVGSIGRVFVNIESTGNALPSGIEYKFRVESLGGVEINGFNAASEYFFSP